MDHVRLTFCPQLCFVFRVEGVNLAVKYNTRETEENSCAIRMGKNRSHIKTVVMCVNVSVSEVLNEFISCVPCQNMVIRLSDYER